MKTKVEIIKAYERYLSSLGQNKNEVFKNFDRMYQYLTNKVEDDKLYQVLTVDCIYKTLKVVRDKQLRFKDGSCEWHKSSIDKAYQLIENIEKAVRHEDWDTYKINVFRLFKLAKEEESPNTRLFIYSKYQEIDEGYRFFKSEKERVSKLLKVETDEEAEKVLSE